LVTPIDDEFRFALARVRQVNAKLQVASRWAPVFGHSQELSYLSFLALSVFLFVRHLVQFLLLSELLVLGGGGKREALCHVAARHTAQQHASIRRK